MNRESVFERKQAGTLVLAAFLTDSFIQPFGRQTEVLPARTAILAGALQFALLCAVMVVYLAGAAAKSRGPSARCSCAARWCSPSRWRSSRGNGSITM